MLQLLYCVPIFALPFALSIVLKAEVWFRVIYNHWFPLSRIPGPRVAAWTRLWMVKVLASGRAHEIWVRVNRDHGSIARIGPNHIVTDDPAVMRRVLGIRSAYRRGPWFDSIKTDAFLGNIASTRDPVQHASMRAKLAPSFRGEALKSSEAATDKMIVGWIDRIRKASKSETGCREIDIAKKIQYLTLDLVTKILLGCEIGYVASDGDVHNFLADVKKANFVVQFMSVFTELTTVLRWVSSVPWLGRFFRAEPNNGNGTGRLVAFINNVLAERQNTARKNDPVTSLLAKGISPRQISSELLVALVAGSDTTATAVQYTLLAITTNAHVYHTLKAEIQLALQCNMISPVIQVEECKRLPYLNACIMEGLRKFPPLAQLREREVPEGGDVINGYFLPAGTFIGFNIRGAQLRKDIYGVDANIFRPERWFEPDQNRLKAMQQTHELMFGYGSTRCLGYSIAIMEISKVIFEIFRNFDVTIAEPHKPWTSTCNGIFFQEDFNVVLNDVDDTAPPAYSRSTSPPLTSVQSSTS